jgi:leucyl aminopeptidase
LPIEIRLTAVPAAGDQPLAAFLEAQTGREPVPAGGDTVSEDIVVPARAADIAGIEPYLGAPADEVMAACDVTSNAGDLSQVVTRLGPVVRRVLFLGLGDGSPAQMRKAGAALARCVGPGHRVLTSAACGQPEAAVHAFAEGVLLGSYRYSLASKAGQDGSGPARDGQPGEVRLLLTGPPAALERAIAVAGAVALARDLANAPAAGKTPAWLADEAAAVAAAGGVTSRVWGPAELAAQGFGGILAVGAGSARPPRLIELRYEPPGWREHVVLVGKGITFDSGGLSLKPNDNMKLMKTDMAGGAAVIAVMSALARLGVSARVTGLIPAAENMPSGSALRPGDVITHFGGRTTEVLNTDAEGRLVLADALAYADAVLQPDVMVDIATLTGAARVALGTSIGALYASDDRLAGALLSAAADSGEPLWRMPLVDDYVDALESPVADAANVPHGTRTRAGSIDAALFLREFTGKRAWAHLDIAGAARSAADEGEQAKGATGFGTRVMLRWLSDLAVPASA